MHEPLPTPSRRAPLAATSGEVNLFVGDMLEQGTLRICEDCFVDLRRIRNPLVIFASYGDNITSPHQALGWISVVYADTEDLKSQEL